MHVILADNQNINLTNITAIEEDIVDKHFQAERQGRQFIDTAHASWDGIYRKYNRAKKQLARPLLGELRALCMAKRLPISIEDQREDPQFPMMAIEDVNDQLLPGITLEEYQITGILKAYSSEVGVMDVPPGGGKTELIAGICKVVNCPTVILAEQKIVVDQIKKRLELRMVVDEVGMFSAGRMPTGQLVIVGTVQSLVVPSKPPTPPQIPEKLKHATASAIYQTRKKGEEYNCELLIENGKQVIRGGKPALTEYGKIEKLYLTKIDKHFAAVKGYKTIKKKVAILQKLIAKCEMIMVDECDLATSKIYQKVFKYWFKGRRRYGFTGTAEDPDRPVEQLIMKEHLGSVIHRISRQRVESVNRTIPFEYYMIAYGETGNKADATMFDIAVNEHMVYSESFHSVIVELCKKIRDADDASGTLILVERDDLGHALKSKIPDCEFIHGKTTKAQRPGILKAFEDRSLKVLIGGKNVKRGMDLAGGCEDLILATGGKLSSGFKQQIGRANRLNKLGKARIWDILFLCNRYLYDHSRRRLKTVISMKYPSYIVFQDGVYDGEKFVKSQYRRTQRNRITKSLF